MKPKPKPSNAPEKRIQVPVRLDNATRKALTLLADSKDVSIQELISEGIEMVFQKYGRPVGVKFEK